MQVGEAALGSGALSAALVSAPQSKAQTGDVEITVEVAAVCWDTFGEDGTQGDRPLPGVSVSLFGAGPAVETDDQGVARFTGVRIGSVNVAASKLDYETVRSTITVNADSTTSHTLTLMSAQRECNRPHTRVPREFQPADPTPLTAMFWSDEPPMLIVRDVLFLLCAVLTIFFLVVGLAAPSAVPEALGVAALCFALLGYHTHIIFGMFAGVPTMVVAFLTFGAVLVMTALAIAGAVPIATATSYGASPPDVHVVPMAAATWAAFALGLAMGRQPYSREDWLVPILGAVLGLVTAVGLYLVLAYLADPAGFAADGGLLALAIIGEFFAGAILGFIGGLMGHMFVNDGNLENPRWEPTDLKLPYTGERYCLQGHRGFFSHFREGEYAYDLIAPIGTPVLAMKEGHIIELNETSKNDQLANTVFVRHRDGTIGEYMHLRDQAVSLVNRAVVAATIPSSGRQRTFGNNPVHVHAGQRLALSGDTGKDVTPHIHVAVLHPGPTDSRNYMAIKFDDLDVARHEGRCFSMRKYRSSNVDRGPIEVPPDRT